MRGALTLVLVLVVVLSGCSAGGGDGADATTEPASTPAPTPGPEHRRTASGDPDGSSLPPGVNASGVDPTRLAEAHGAALEGRSYTTRSNWTLEGEIAVPLPDRADVVREVSASRDRIRARVENGSVTSHQYVENGTLYEKRVSDGETSFLTSKYEPLRENQSFASADTLRTYLSVAEFAPTGTEERDGRTLVVIEAEDDPEDAILAENLTTFRARALVDERGVVREFVLRAEGETAGHRFALDVTLAVESVGNTTVTPPDWLEEAETTASSVRRPLTAAGDSPARARPSAASRSGRR